MRYQHLKTYKKVRKFLVPVVPALIALLLLLTKTEAPLFATNVVYVMAKPFWSARDAIVQTTEHIVLSFSSKNTLIQENAFLREKTLSLTRETFLTRSLAHENARLFELLGRVDANPELLPASVLHGNTFSPYDTFFIDQGVQQGIRENMLVLTPENIAIGSITKALDHTSIVTRFSASGFSYDVLLGATSSVHTNMKGFGSGTMLITVPRDTETAVTDVVTLPSFKTYTIGSVVSIEVTPEDAFKILYVASPVNIYELRYVLVDTTTVWNVETTKTEENTESTEAS